MLNILRTFLSPRNVLRLAWHQSKTCIAAMLYRFPARKLIVIGITGTDGKTTTVGMIAHILRITGIQVGALSTAFFRANDLIEWNATQKTSPSPFVIQHFLHRLVAKGCTHTVIEYSSHGLVQGRTLFTWPSVAAITNTSPEHLDYHGTMEQYRKDKGKLFRMLHGKGTKILNADDETYNQYLQIPSERTLSYSLSDPIASKISISIPGKFNIENALCALRCAEAIGIPTQQSLEALRTFAGIPGRMECIDEGQPFTVFIDFTVTPAAYEKTLSAIRLTLTAGHRLLVLAGSCGDRMRENRHLIGNICTEFADIIVVTNEDPYTEDPEKIINEVWNGIDQKMMEAHRIPDRRKAMTFLFRKAEPGDIVLLCGKGSDITMWIASGQIPWNEREITRELLRDLRCESEKRSRPPRQPPEEHTSNENWHR